MNDYGFNEADLHVMKSLGITETQIRKQIEIFSESSCHVKLARPCTLNDGIRGISARDAESYLEAHREAAHEGRFMKFVPASGAATRMFQAILKFCNSDGSERYEETFRKAESGDAHAAELLQCMDGIRKFAFYEDLKETMSVAGLNAERLIRMREFKTVLEYVAKECGLNCGSLPKGLLKFHRYPTESRTAFEEHLYDSVHFLRDRWKLCRLHFTVSPEHDEKFRSLLKSVQPHYEKRLGARYDISFSYQKQSTNTIAVDANNLPFRDRNGSLVFRPGGHGALLQNLNDFMADLVYIRNIDNVAIDRLKEATFLWKKILGGCLAAVQKELHYHVRRLKSWDSQELIADAAAFAGRRLLIPIPEDFHQLRPEEKKAFLLKELDRPIRVCGVVENTGEPGGAPFWTVDRNGRHSLQIVEKAQVDLSSSEQREIWMSSTHFNPVDLVCGVTDSEGKHFDLTQYVDPQAVFISTKSLDGMELKALELPGLWNGAMSGWITLFVEVPKITFNPVKTINDLLRPEHQWDALKIEPLEWTNTRVLSTSGRRSVKARATESASAKAIGS
jgi:hypothetical protein